VQTIETINKSIIALLLAHICVSMKLAFRELGNAINPVELAKSPSSPDFMAVGWVWGVGLGNIQAQFLG